MSDTSVNVGNPCADDGVTLSSRVAYETTSLGRRGESIHAELLAHPLSALRRRTDS